MRLFCRSTSFQECFQLGWYVEQEGFVLKKLVHYLETKFFYLKTPAKIYDFYIYIQNVYYQNINYFLYSESSRRFFHTIRCPFYRIFTFFHICFHSKNLSMRPHSGPKCGTHISVCCRTRSSKKELQILYAVFSESEAVVSEYS